MKVNSYTVIKSIVDFMCALILLVLSLPVMLVVGVLIKIDSEGPVFFKQNRPGIHGNIFSIYKFRTMSFDTDDAGQLLPDKERITKIGAIIRKLSIDELPQLLNVVFMEMSFVGPRPLLPEYIPYYTDYERARHSVRPGITGWAQVNGRNAICWDQKLKLDVYYVENMSLRLDLKILLLTIYKVFKRDGVDSSETETMERLDIIRQKRT